MVDSMTESALSAGSGPSGHDPLAASSSSDKTGVETQTTFSTGEVPTKSQTTMSLEEFGDVMSKQRLEDAKKEEAEQSLFFKSEESSSQKASKSNRPPFSFPSWSTVKSHLPSLSTIGRVSAIAGLATSVVVCGVFALGMWPGVVVGGVFVIAGVVLSAKSKKNSSKDILGGGLIVIGAVLAAPVTGLVFSCWGLSKLF
jgi:hypothetical protein